MKQIAPLGSLRAGIVAGLAAVLPVGPVAAQTLPLPSLEITATPDSKQVTVDWAEVPQTEGRQFSHVTFAQWDSLGVAPFPTIQGSYVRDCDYFLRITKIPQDPGVNRRTLLLYHFFANTTGVGAPLRVDTLQIVAPDSLHTFNPGIAGDLGIVVPDNIGPPSGPLGSVPLTLGGVNSTLNATAGYFATALNSVTSLSRLRVQISGPVDLSAIPDPLPTSVKSDTLLVTTPGQRFPMLDAMTIAFGDGAAAPGDTAKWTAHYLCQANGRITMDLEAFEGYHVWRSTLPDVNSFTLVGEIRPCESKFDFVLLTPDDLTLTSVELLYDPGQRHFTLIDRGVHNDFPYRYAISTFDRGFLGNPEDLTYEGPRSESAKLYPAMPARDRAQQVYVVPNPYKRHVDFQEGDAKIVFANLPTDCTIRIFTESTDHLITLHHGANEPHSTSPTSREWNLRTESGAPIAPGIYIFYIQGTNRYQRAVSGGGTETVAEPFEQVGKFIVAR